MKDSTQKNLPSTARVVIVGGGIVGCGLAYHLTREGWSDIVLLEKGELTSGSTWHAAGQITRSISSVALGHCVNYNIQLVSGLLERETGISVSWHGCGSIRIAYTDDEMDWLRHILSVTRAINPNIQIISPKEIHRLHPFYNLDGVKGGLHTMDDGHVDPSGISHALAKGARQNGASIFTRCLATDIYQQSNGEWVVVTELGNIVCEHVVNAGGTYARQIGEWNGLQLPMVSMTHHYFVTEPVPEFQNLESELPVIRDDNQVSGYVRMEQKSGLIGIYEKQNPNSVWNEGCPWEIENHLFDADYERVLPWLAKAFERMPVLSDIGIRRVVHGAISHPPDGNPLIGPVGGLKNYWCCCGIQIGIGWGPGLTRELARWMVWGAGDISMREYDPRRFGTYADKQWQLLKGKEDYCLRHEIPFPHLNRLAGRPVRTSPLYERLKDCGAVFEEVRGYERPRWFATGNTPAIDQYSFRRTTVHEIVGREVAAVRNHAGVMDISAFTKIEVSGPGVDEFLSGLTASRIPRKIGGIALAYLLNHRGRIELEAIFVKIQEHQFYLVCSIFFEQHLLDILSQNQKAHQFEINNLTDSWSAINLQGPKSREILNALVDDPLDNQSFPWFRAKSVRISNCDLMALRISYSGELGWELHGPRNSIQKACEAIWDAGQSHGLINYGSFAMNVMRMEKMYKGMHEFTNEITLREADVMRFVDRNKDFVGKAATIKSLLRKPPWKCAYLKIEPNGTEDGNGGETVYSDNRVVGTVSSIVYGHSVGSIAAFAYLKPEVAIPGTKLQVDIAGRLRNAEVVDQPLYDPQNLRPKVDCKSIIQ